MDPTKKPAASLAEEQAKKYQYSQPNNNEEIDIMRFHQNPRPIVAPRQNMAIPSGTDRPMQDSTSALQSFPLVGRGTQDDPIDLRDSVHNGRSIGRYGQAAPTLYTQPGKSASSSINSAGAPARYGALQAPTVHYPSFAELHAPSNVEQTAQSGAYGAAPANNTPFPPFPIPGGAGSAAQNVVSEDTVMQENGWDGEVEEVSAIDLSITSAPAEP
jgi:hypothetical protein